MERKKSGLLELIDMGKIVGQNSGRKRYGVYAPTSKRGNKTHRAVMGGN